MIFWLLLACGLLALTGSNLQAQISSYFRIINGIPHLPVVTTTADVTSPLPGSIVYSKTDGEIRLYSGTAWVDFCANDLPGGTGSRTIFSVIGGIPVLPVKAAIATASVAGDIYYPTTGGGLVVNDGTTSWYTIPNVPATITATSAQTQLGSLDAIKGGFVLPVLAADPTGVQNGALYLNTTKKIRFYNGTNWVSFYCGCPIKMTVNHLSTDGFSPISTTITYSFTASSLTGTPSCWLVQNLGASSPAASSTTINGWYWQFGQKQGYQSDGTTRTPNTTWNSSISSGVNWSVANDPCTNTLGASWRLPTLTEWTNAATNGGWTNLAIAYSSDLKLSCTQMLYWADATFGSGNNGNYWSSTRYDSTSANLLILTSTNIMYNIYRNSYAVPVRCLKTL